MRKTKKKFRKFYAYLLISLILVCSLYYLRYNSNINNPVDKNDPNNISFQIKKGETAKIIGQNLEEKGLIKNALHFYLYAKFNHQDTSILPGRFKLRKNMNVPEILETISNPASSEAIITIQEGLKITDIDQKLTEQELIERGDFIAAVKNFNNWSYYSFLDQATAEKLPLPLEGYLYPDTYFLDPSDFKPEDLIYLALDNFEKKFSNLQSQIHRHTINEIITMASILENEVTSDEDRKLVSGILWKRLESGWTLGADATLLYISEDRSISQSDLQSDSPYNTRKNAGLPPGPISNPSISSIEAAMYPEESEYWFYLSHPETGKTIYAKTNEEQNLNRDKYLN